MPTMKVTITLERPEPSSIAVAEMHCLIASGNGYLRHDETLHVGQSTTITFNAREMKGKTETITLELTGIT